ncbi:MAG TPA: hypothetical protein VJ161_06270 [Geobacteraceae bacterium]|nr:hypothetical protein [Geobacteraceae bacterium]
MGGCAPMMPVIREAEKGEGTGADQGLETCMSPLPVPFDEESQGAGGNVSEPEDGGDSR